MHTCNKRAASARRCVRQRRCAALQLQHRSHAGVVEPRNVGIAGGEQRQRAGIPAVFGIEHSIKPILCRIMERERVSERERETHILQIFDNFSA